MRRVIHVLVCVLMLVLISSGVSGGHSCPDGSAMCRRRRRRHGAALGADHADGEWHYDG